MGLVLVNCWSARLTPMPDWTEHATIYLSPWCVKCEREMAGEDRLWCPEPQDPCEYCRKPWVKFVLAGDQPPIPLETDDDR